MSAPRIEVASPSDLAGLGGFRRAWDTGAPPTTGETDAEFDARLQRWFAEEADRRTFWLAWLGDEPIGLAGLLEYRALPTPGRPQRCWGYLGNMHVAAGHRDRGVGRLLLDAALAAADERGYARVLLAPSVRSIPFYRRAGFVDAGPDAAGDRLMVRPAAR